MTQAEGERLTWPDIARGACVVLVVLHHVSRQMVDQAPGSWAVAGEFWSFLDAFLTPIRIPLFFFISALLVQSALSRSWDLSKKRVIVPVYLYVLWSTLLTLRLLVPGGVHEHSLIANLFGNLLLAGSGYWYLYALPLYFLYARWTRNWPWWVAIIPLVPGLLLRDSITVWSQQAGYLIMDSASLLGSILANGVFYWLGARYGRNIVRLVVTSRWAIVGFSISYIALQGLGMFSGFSEYLLPLASVVGIGLGVATASALPRQAPLARGLKFLGARTLPVYVLQFFFISILSFVWSRVSQLPLVDGMYPFSWIYPAFVTAIVVSLSLACYALAMRTKLLSWLFQPPSSWLGAGAGSSARP